MSNPTPALLPGGFDPRRGRPCSLTVLDAAPITPRMRRVTLTVNGSDEFAPKPGQELVLALPDGTGEPARRHYTIRRYDVATRTLAIDILLHGDTPGPRWAQAAKPGDHIDAMGPRGRIVPNPAADWHVLSGDETGIPGLFAIAEALPPESRIVAFLEIADEAERQLPARRGPIEITWLVRNGAPAEESTLLVEALAGFRFPEGIGHFYLVGETRVVRAQRQALLARGIDGRTQIAAEGYWRPGRVGGHDHVDHDEHGPMAPRPR